MRELARWAAPRPRRSLPSRAERARSERLSRYSLRLRSIASLDLGGHHLDDVLQLDAVLSNDGLAVFVEDALAEPDLPLREKGDVAVILAAVSGLVHEQRAELVVADVAPVDDRALRKGHGIEGLNLAGPPVGVFDVCAHEVLMQRDIGVLWCFLAHVSPPLRLMPV